MIYPLLRNRYNLEADDRSDFFCDFYPEIPLLLHRFYYQGKPFRHFLLNTLKWKVRTYLKRKQKSLNQKVFFERESFWGPMYWEDSFEVGEPAPPLSREARRIFEIDNGTFIRDPVLKKRLIILTMKGSMYVDHHIAQYVSIITGYSPDWLFHKIQELKDIVITRSSRIHQLRIKRNKYFVKIYNIHVELVLEVYPGKRQALYQQLFHYKERMLKVINEISKISNTPTHSDIARIIDTPKGSVDSSLYYLKNSFNPEYRSISESSAEIGEAT